MEKMKKLLALLLSVVMCVTCLAACGNGGNGGGNGDSDVNADGEVVIEWWISYATEKETLLQKLVDDFNTLHDGEYEVKVVYAGGYPEIRAKLDSTKDAKNLPGIVAGQPVVNAYYASIDSIVPIQEFIDKDEEDWTNGTYETVKTAYSDRDGKLIGWPVGVSSAGWFVNVDLLKKAGYTTADMTSYEKIAQIATAVASKGVAEYGIAYYYTGMDLYDAITLQGCDFVDNDNGMSKDATKSVITEGDTNKALKSFLSATAKLYEKNYAYTYQANTDNDIMPAFVDGKIAIMGATNSYTHKLMFLNPEFDWEFVPNTVATEAGQYKGYALCEGAGNYIVDNGNEKIMQGSYEFIKFLAKVENQTYWCTNTGYIPYTDEAFADEAYQTWMKENLPEAEKMQTTLKAIPKELRGPYLGLAEDIQAACRNMIGVLAVDPDSDLDELIEEYAMSIDEAIEIDAIRKK